MPSSPFRLFDPEIVVPSAVSASTLQFWQRMHEWAGDRGPRIGPSTLQALNEFAQNPPKVAHLSTGDFWTILGKYTSRGFAPSPTPREVCEEHLSTSYKPLAGALDNIQRLIEDVRAVGANSRVAISTLSACWPDKDPIDCPVCDASRLSHVYKQVVSESKSDELAKVWRQAYVEEHAADPTQLEAFASKMFPAIEFSSAAWKRIKTLVGAPEEMTAAIIGHLAVLNDCAATIWAETSSTEARQAMLSARGVTSSPEGPKTHKNKKAMGTRDFDFNSGQVRCEWHTKLRPDVNRIYFAVSDGKVFVGTIVDHLPT
jgi:hypothetical protein